MVFYSASGNDISLKEKVPLWASVVNWKHFPAHHLILFFNTLGSGGRTNIEKAVFVFILE